MLAGLKGAVAYLDNAIVVGRTEEENRRSLEAVLRRISESGIHIRLEKCSFGKLEIKYLGEVLYKNSRKPDLEKVKAIVLVPGSTSLNLVRAFLGVINCEGKYVGKMDCSKAPLDELLKKNAKWSQQCQRAFEETKRVLQLN